MKMIDLFSGIGGFSLAAHWAGFETLAFVERDKFCQKVLQKNFPGTPIFDDIIKFDGKQYNGAADIVCGGFPCQPFSTAGKRKGAEDSRHLWPEMLRVISEVRPKWVIGENVAGILTMDSGNLFESICLDLEAEGYEVQPYIIPAISVGAPHRRDRVWIVAKDTNSGRNGINETSRENGINWNTGTAVQIRPTPDPIGEQNNTPNERGIQQESSVQNTGSTPDNSSQRLQSNPCGQFGSIPETVRTQPGRTANGTFATGNSCNAECTGLQGQDGMGSTTGFEHGFGIEQWRTHWYEVAARLCRVDDGLPGRVDRHSAARLKALGNSIVPQIAYQIFEAIKAEK